MKYKLYATCPDEITDLLAAELAMIGGQEIKTGFRVVYFTANEEVYYKVHLYSRLASRIFRIIKEIPAGTPQIIFDKTRRIKFHEYFDITSAVRIKVTTAAKEMNIPTHLVGSKIREALEDSCQHYCERAANISSRDANICLRAFLYDNRLMISLDTSLNSLHKRGHRVDGHPAPLKETLAASLLAICGYDGKMPLYDPMCGSGSIAIEGAQIASNIAPLIDRNQEEFGFSHLKDFNSQLWGALQQEAREAKTSTPPPIFASDISSEYIQIAKKSAQQAGVEKHLNFKTVDFFKTKKPAESGLLIANLPYGLRLDDDPIDKEYLRAIGDHLKQHYQGWKCGLLVSENSPYKEIGLKPERRVSLLNGAVKVKFICFSVY